MAAFLKRMLQTAFKCDLKLMKSMLCIGKHLLSKFPKAYMLLETDDITDSYVPSLQDPYLAQASTSSIIPELQAFKALQDSQVKSLVSAYFHKKPLDKKPLDYFI